MWRNNHPYHKCEFKLIKDNTIKQCNNMINSDKEIIGYKLIKPEYRLACRAIMKHDKWFDSFFDINLENYGYNFGPLIPDNLEESGVFKLWFEPVYKNIITTRVRLRSSSGDFELEINKNKIYYKHLNINFSIIYIEEVIKSFISTGNHTLAIKVESLTVIGKKDTVKADWENVLYIYNKINKTS